LLSGLSFETGFTLTPFWQSARKPNCLALQAGQKASHQNGGGNSAHSDRFKPYIGKQQNFAFRLFGKAAIRCASLLDASANLAALFTGKLTIAYPVLDYSGWSAWR